MVTTRAQSSRSQKQGSRSPSRVIVDSDSSSDRGHDRRVQTVGSASRRRSAELLAREALQAAPGAAAATAGAGEGAPPPTERLGRGHRISRETRTLDEEYLAKSYDGAQGRRGPNHSNHRHALQPRHRRRGEADAQEDFIIHERYPPRAAAQRALWSLQHTLEHENGRGDVSEDEDDERCSGNGEAVSARSDGFHFRNHPEIGERLKRDDKSWRHADSATTTPSSSDNAASTSSSSSGDSSDSGYDHHNGKSCRALSPATRQRTSHAVAPSYRARTGDIPTAGIHYSNGSGKRNSGGGGHKRGRTPSIDSSISNESMREASVAEAARNDERVDRRLRGPLGSDEDSDSGDDDVVTEREMRRAQRNAKESTTRNVNINHYMRDAIGAEDSHKKRRRRADRRYQHLLMLDEEEKEAEVVCGGNGGLGDSGGGGSFGGATGSATTAAAGALGDITPLNVTGDITFASVGGLPGHMVTLREMVLLPLLYPQLLRSMNLSPPRGVLFVGPPGTGKTLMARALAVEGSRCGERKVAFFIRKGADILSKWVGESERQLKLLFEEAKRQQPSIIFFDEIDGLAPTRHTKTEQTQAALVATLLALLDGLDDRGQVVVIGATNRPDAMDPALRRPGRFDRELLFPLPDSAARRHILTILTAKQTFAPPTRTTTDASVRALHAAATAGGSTMLVPQEEQASDKTAIIDELVAHTEGYSGADLKALCVEAGLNRLRTALPQLYTTSRKLLLPAGPAAPSLAVRREDFFAAARRISPSLQRGGQEMHALHLEEHLDLLMRTQRDALLAAMSRAYAAVGRALARERRDCGDIQSAVRRLSSFPIPLAQHCLLCFLHVGETHVGGLASSHSVINMKANATHNKSASKRKRKRTSSTESVDFIGAPLPPASVVTATAAVTRQMVLTGVCVAVMRGLPAFQPFVVHMPHLRVTYQSFCSTDTSGAMASVLSGGGDGGATATSATGMSFSGGHVYHLVQAVQRCSPCMVLLRGAEEWLRDQGLPVSAPCKNNRDPMEQGGGCDRGEHRRSGDRTQDAEENPFHFPPDEFFERRARMECLRYYLNLLAGTEAVLLIPCASPATRRALLGETTTTFQSAPVTASTSDGAAGVEVRRMSAAQHQLHPRFTILQAEVRPSPSRADLVRFVSHLFRTVALAFHMQSGMAARAAAGSSPNSHSTTVTGAGGGDFSGLGAVTLDEDRTPSTPVQLTREQRRAKHAEALALWRRVEYRRLQLRHVLLKWCVQFVSQGRFKLLLSADLDLAPGSDMLHQWRRHTRRTRIGLDDILARLEAEEYVCLSQFHDDVDQLVRNVRSFFRSRSPHDQRYRLKALDLKEATVLNMYKINRNVVRLCETYRDLVEPTPLEEKGGGGEGEDSVPDVGSDGYGLLDTRAGEDKKEDRRTRALHFPQRAVREPGRPKRKLRIFGRRRRRRRQAAAVQPRRPPTAVDAEGLHKEEEESEERPVDLEGNEERASRSATRSEASDSQGCEKKSEKQRRSRSRSPPDGAATVATQEGKSPTGCRRSSSKSTSQSASAQRQEQAQAAEDDNEDNNSDASVVSKAPSSSMPPLSLASGAQVEQWAVDQLVGLTYHELHGIFQGVMQLLEAEVRSREEAADGSSSTAATTRDDGGGEKKEEALVQRARRALDDSPQPRPSEEERFVVGATALAECGRQGTVEGSHSFFVRALSRTVNLLCRQRRA